jgi:MFS family permease
VIAVFRQRTVALLWFGQFLSLLGDWTLFIGLPIFVYSQTGSALATGAMFIAQTLPYVLFGSVAGVFVDRWDRRWTMVVVDLLRALLLFALPAALDAGTWLWLIYPTAFAETTLGQFSTRPQCAHANPGRQKDLLTLNALMGRLSPSQAS